MSGFFSLQGWGAIRLAFGGMVIAALCAALFWWMSRPDFQVLFADLEPGEASAVVEALEKRNVPYQLADEGRRVLVGRDALYPMRMKLLGDGLDLKGTVGLELFSQTEYGMTEFSQKINYLRALQGELARTVMGFDEVRRARVHLALADSSALRRRGPGAKASVWVTLAEGRALQREQVSGIQRLVASAIPALSPSAVTVLDHRGVALSLRAGDDDGVAAEDVRLQWKKDIETHLARKAAGILDATLGPERATVAVDVVLDPSVVRLTRESVLGADGSGSGVLVRKRERRSGGEKPAPGPEGAGVGTPVTSDSVEAEYLAGREVRQTVLGSGAIRRIGVGVVLREALPDDGLARLRDVISLAVGLDAGRGDGIAFTLAGASTPPPLAGSDAPAAAPPRGDAPSLMRPWLPVALSPVLAGTLVLLWRRIRRRQSPSSLSEHERERLLVQVRGWLSMDDEGKAAP